MTSLNQAYQLFVDEVPELLQQMETGLLHIQVDKSTAKVHDIMRAAHSIKGGAASVGLQTIKNIAHQLEDYLKALYNDDLVVDTQLENLFLEAYDCLAIPLTQQLETGDFDRVEAQTKIDLVKAKLEPKIEQALKQVENYVPSSEDLGIDLVQSLFEVDVAQEIRRFKGLVTSPETFNIEQELAESLAILKGLSEVADLPGFSILLSITEQALENNPDKMEIIASLFLHDLEIIRNLVLDGDCTEGGNPCSSLLKLAEDIDADLDASAVNRIIKDQKVTLTLSDPVYQFFLAEIPDLLHTLESALLSIKDDKSISNINDIMRAAHSIKGGAASVGLDGIKNIAHKLEDYIKALFDETVIVNDQLETDFLNAFDCLKNALAEQTQKGNYSNHWQQEADAVWQKLDKQLGAIALTDYLPSSEDLGIDIVQSLFEVDLANTIEQLQTSLENLSGYELLCVINEQLDIILGLGEVTVIPSLKKIATTTAQALILHPQQVNTIASLLIDDVKALQQQVLDEGKDTQILNKPSSELLKLAQISTDDNDDDLLMNLVEAVEEDNPPLIEAEFNTTLDFTELVSELSALEENEHPSTFSEISSELEEISSSASDNPSTMFTLNFGVKDNKKEDVFSELIDLPESSLFEQEFSQQISAQNEEEGKQPPLENIFEDISLTENFLVDNSEEEEKQSIEDIFEQVSTEDIFGDISLTTENVFLDNDESLDTSIQQQELQAQSYQFFIEEAVDLIAQIDENLEAVLANRHVNLINEVARCAHSLKGGSRSAGLENLGMIALRVEKSFKALFNEEIPLSNSLKSYLEEIYQLLRQAVIARIENQEFDEETAVEIANQMWAEFEGQFGEEIAKAQEYLPSSSDLGIDIATSIFEVDVLEGINHLQSALDSAEESAIKETITIQTEVFLGFGEMLSLPGFVSICQTATEALSRNSDEQLQVITQELIDSLKFARQEVLKGDCTEGGKPSQQLSFLAGKTTIAPDSDNSIDSTDEQIDSTKDQAYTFFVEEAPELLQILENGLLNLKEEKRVPAKIHELMRAAHSLKGGASNFHLEGIKTISHRLEDVFKVLYNPKIEVDTELETWLLESYDCLDTALNSQIETGSYDQEKILNRAEAVWQNIQAKLGTALTRSNDYMPSSTDLGIDIVESMFEVDVAEQLQRLKSVSTQPITQPLMGELRATLEVFSGFGKILNLSGFEDIGVLGLQAIETNPDCLVLIAKILIRDVEKARSLVLDGDRITGGEPSLELISLAQQKITLDEEMQPSIEQIFGEQLTELDHIFRLTPISKDTQINTSFDEESLALNQEDLEIDDVLSSTEEEITDNDSSESIVELEDIFASELTPSQINLLSSASKLALEQDKNQTIPSVEEIFQLPEIEDILDLDDDNDDSVPLIENTSVSSIFGYQEDEPEVFNFTENKAQNNELSPSIEDVFGTFDYEVNDSEEAQTEVVQDNNLLPFSNQDLPQITIEDTKLKDADDEQISDDVEIENVPTNLTDAIQSIGDIYQKLPSIKTDAPLKPTTEILKKAKSKLVAKSNQKTSKKKTNVTSSANNKSNLTIRVDLDRLERMNNLIGELSINRNGLSLQNDKLQTSVEELTERFGSFQQMANNLRDLADQMLVSPEKFAPTTTSKTNKFSLSPSGFDDEQFNLNSAFDALEMDCYDNLYGVVQGLIEQMIQLEEAVDDIALFASQTGETVEGQRQMLNRLRDELMWARMLPLAEILNRFPRVLRDLSVKYNKKVNLKMDGTSVLVDKAALEKLYDPLVHLIRNAFDHGIETPEIRRQRGKSIMGTIQVKAYHQGNQTIIEIKDDGNGLNLDKIRNKAIDRQLITLEQSNSISEDDLLNIVFEPGFSTATAVTEISGRGVGLDIVRSQLRALKGNITVNSEKGKGTTFILSLPLTLTIDKLLVLSMGPHFYALPSDNITEIIVPETKQIKTSGNQRFLHFENKIVPIYSLNNLLEYRCYVSELTTASTSLEILPTPEEWGNPLLVLSLGKELFAIEVENLVSEQELVIKPFGKSLSAPSYTYGCTILSDGTLIPVINTATLLSNFLQVTQGIRKVQIPINTPQNEEQAPTSSIKTFQVATVLIVDDSAAMRRTLALSLEKAGYRVIQAKDGKEAFDQLQQLNNVNLVICDIEMPNMNGFEFLGQRRRYPELGKIPVAMLTSRSNDKHRKLATHLGANAYFTKPYIEQKFLQSIGQLIEQKSLATI